MLQLVLRASNLQYSMIYKGKKKKSHDCKIPFLQSEKDFIVNQLLKSRSSLNALEAQRHSPSIIYLFAGFYIAESFGLPTKYFPNRGWLKGGQLWSINRRKWVSFIVRR